MNLTFEYDDYPRDAERFLCVMDRLKEDFPGFKCSVFAIPNEMEPKHFEEIEKRPHLKLYPHGINHRKGECRPASVDKKTKQKLVDIKNDKRYGNVFKAPWHGMSSSYMHALHEIGFIPVVKFASIAEYPFPSQIMIYNKLDRCYQSHNNNYGKVHVAVESHPSNYKINTPTQKNQINDNNISKWTKTWKNDYAWDFVDAHIRPGCLKLNLGCGTNILEGWANLDPRDHLDKSIIKWSFKKLIPFAPWTADIVFTSHVFNYIDETKYVEALVDIWRVLRPGGILRMSEDATDSGYIWRKPGQKARRTGVIRSLPTKSKIVQALKTVGFEIHGSTPDETLSPHKDVLKGNSRSKRYRLGHKYYIEATKRMEVNESLQIPIKSDPLYSKKLRFKAK